MKLKHHILSFAVWACFVIIFSYGCTNHGIEVGMLASATEFYELGDFDSAIPILSNIISNSPCQPQALLLRSKCYFEKMERRLQAADLTRLISIDTLDCKQRIIYANDIANAYDYIFLDDSTIKYQRMILSLKKSCIETEFAENSVYEILANLYNRKGEYSFALSLIDTSEQLGNDRYSINTARFNVYSKAGEQDSALKWINAAIETQTEFPGTITELGWDFQDRADLYHQKGNLKAACADWQKALDLGLKEAQPKLDSFCRGR